MLPVADTAPVSVTLKNNVAKLVCVLAQLYRDNPPVLPAPLLMIISSSPPDAVLFHPNKVLPVAFDAPPLTVEISMVPRFHVCNARPVNTDALPDAVIFPLALITPAVNKLPPVILPVPEILPPEPVVTIALPTRFPVALTMPVMFRPNGVNTATLPTVLTLIVTLALAALIFKLLLPFNTLDTDVIIPVN